MTDEMLLVREYAASNSEQAFAALVSRHINLVYSVAQRQVGDPHLAEEITQAVFIILARKARTLGSKTILSAWLCRTARYVSADALKTRRRRQGREQEAYMQSTLCESEPDTWAQVAPMLDGALNCLGKKEHNAIVLRFLEGKDLKQVGAAMGIGEDAARMRINRGVERLRAIFAKRGVVMTATFLVTALSANSVQAAPIGLAKLVAAVGIAKGAAAGGSILVLVKGALHLMALAKAKTTALVTAVVILTAGTAVIAIDDSLWNFADYNLDKTPPGIVVIRPTHFAGGDQGGLGSMLGKLGGRNQAFLQVLCAAYDGSAARVILNVAVPEGRFDYAVTRTNQPEQELQAEIRRQFGLVAHPEVRETEVFLLKTNSSNSSKMKPSAAVSGIFGVTTNQLIFTNQPISLLREYLEVWAYRKPVLDQTGLTGRYDFALDWPKPTGYLYKQGQETLRTNLTKQLGLELVPTNPTSRIRPRCGKSF